MKRCALLPVGAALLLPGYRITLVSADNGMALMYVDKDSKKIKGLKYQTIVLDEFFGDEDAKT